MGEGEAEAEGEEECVTRQGEVVGWPPYWDSRGCTNERSKRAKNIQSAPSFFLRVPVPFK